MFDTFYREEAFNEWMLKPNSGNRVLGKWADGSYMSRRTETQWLVWKAAVDFMTSERAEEEVTNRIRKDV